MKSEVNIFTTLLMLFLIGCSKEAEEDIPVVITPSSATLIFPENNSECNEGKVISDTDLIFFGKPPNWFNFSSNK